ncbi:MAG: hypothetical protein Q7T11_08535 [Deltaproteobacteria bacterium]|nr:hypothetical protein [Deltaproteobacteria bacterium]
MSEEKSITKLDDYIGRKIQVTAYGTIYVGTLQKVDYEEDYLILTDGKDTVTLDLDRIESFAGLA